VTKATELPPEALSRERWRRTGPDSGLTWGQYLSGDRFVERVLAHRTPRPDDRILEVGPGYGRILDSLIRLEVPFASYTGIDLSEANVGHLREAFSDEPRARFVHADIEQLELDDRFDLAVSSLTFKHLYPTFEQALRRIAAHLAPGGFVVFDLLESGIVARATRHGAYWKRTPDSSTWVHRYRQQDAARIVRDAGLELAGFDHVTHTKGKRRLLVTARTPGSSPDKASETDGAASS
jgi:SAM-dependent methyltransferase